MRATIFKKMSFPFGLLFFFTFFSLAISVADAGPEDVLKVGLFNDFETVDPHAFSPATGNFLLDNLYEPLVDMDNEMTKLVPVLALSWEKSQDGLRYMLPLRKGVKFSDGTPFNSQAVKFSFERAKKVNKLPYSYVNMVQDVETPDEYTVVFKLKEPFSPFLAGLRFFFIVSPAAVKDHEKNGDLAQNWLNEHSAGTGPYKVDSWQRGIKMVLSKNDGYWRKWEGKHFSELILQPIADPDVQRLMLEKGDLDIAQLVSIDYLPALRKNPNIRVIQGAYDSVLYAFINAAARPTNDVKVRKAIAHSWNHDVYTGLRNGFAPRADGPTPNILLGKGYSLKNPYDYNLEKAKKLITEAGYPEGSSLTLKVLTQKGDEQKRMQYEVLRAELAKLNIKLDLVVLTYPAQIKAMSDWGKTKDAETAYHMSLMFVPVTVLSPYGFLYQVYNSEAHIDKGGRNYSYYSNKEVDKLVKEAMATLDQEKSLELWRRANEIVMSEIPALFLDKMTFTVAMRNDIKGFYFKGAPSYNNYYSYYR